MSVTFDNLPDDVIDIIFEKAIHSIIEDLKECQEEQVKYIDDNIRILAEFDQMSVSLDYMWSGSVLMNYFKRTYPYFKGKKKKTDLVRAVREHLRSLIKPITERLEELIRQEISLAQQILTTIESASSYISNTHFNTTTEFLKEYFTDKVCILEGYDFSFDNRYDMLNSHFYLYSHRYNNSLYGLFNSLKGVSLQNVSHSIYFGALYIDAFVFNEDAELVESYDNIFLQ
jgi:hypothetical protein